MRKQEGGKAEGRMEMSEHGCESDLNEHVFTQRESDRPMLPRCKKIETLKVEIGSKNGQ